MNDTLPQRAVAPVFELTEHDDVLMLKLRGELGSLAWGLQLDGLEETVRIALHGLPQARLVVDLSEVTYGGSEFVQFLFRLKKRLGAYGGQAVLTGPRGHVAEVLQITKLDRLLQERSTLEEAFATVRAKAPPRTAV